MKRKTEFGYKSICNNVTTIYYLTTHKIIYYFSKMSFIFLKKFVGTVSFLHKFIINRTVLLGGKNRTFCPLAV